MTQEIKKLTVTNFKGVKQITVHPDGPLAVIAGGNGEGKSSFIDAFVEMFEPKGVRLTPKPIREGETEAVAELTTDEVRIVRTWKKNDAGALSVFALDGAKYGSGKDFIQKATGGALFDPQAFINMDEKKQREQLLARVDLPFDLDELASKRKGAFDQRTDVGRDVTRLEAQLAGYPAADPSVPTEEVSAAAVLAEYEAAREHNRKLGEAMDACGAAEAESERAAAEVTRLVDALDAARTYHSRAKETEEALLAAFRAGPDRIDTDEISARLDKVEQTNGGIRVQAHRAAVAAELADRTAERDAFTAKLAEIDKTKADALAAVTFPIEGLSVDDDGIVFNGVPFKQINTAQKIAIAFDLATSAQPDLRLIVVKDGDLLDSASLASIKALAEARGYLVLMERDRDESRQIGFTIVDGEVSA